MNLFTWLVVGHMVGDWILQNDWMARGKKGALLTIPGLTHFSVYTTAVMIVIWFVVGRSLSIPEYLVVAAFVFITHMLTDATDVVGMWMRFYQQTDIPMVRVMVDQTFHLVELTAVALMITAMTG